MKFTKLNYRYAPPTSGLLEIAAGGLPLVGISGLNTAKATNLSGFLVDTSGNVTAPGTLAVTGVATFTASPVFTAAPTGTYFTVNYIGQTTEAATDRNLFVAPIACTLVAASCSFAVAAGGASVLQLTKDTGTTAPGAGTDILTNNTNTGYDLNAAANTPQVGTFAATSFAIGDRLSMDFANAIQSSAGLVISIILKTS